MKKTNKLFGIVAIVATIGLLAVSCLTFEPAQSLDGVWSRGDIIITISGNNAVFTQFSPNYRHIEAVNIGVLNIGDLCNRNIRQTGNLRWTGDSLVLDMEVDSYGTIVRYTGTSWRNCTITMSATGRTIRIEADGFAAEYYTRVQ
jgi:hypothetical protein